MTVIWRRSALGGAQLVHRLRAGPRRGETGIAQAAVAKRILGHLGLDSTGPPVARAAPPPEQVDLGPSYDAHHSANPTYHE